MKSIRLIIRLLLALLFALCGLCPVGKALSFNDPHKIKGCAPSIDTAHNAEISQVEAKFQSRKNFLNHGASMLMLPFANTLTPEMALAAAPITTKETDSLGVMARRAFRPKPPKVLRRKLSQDFAVLLMRSSYNSLDQLDCVPMDQFQRDFFLTRRSEYEPYTKDLGPGMVQQGDLTDPYYFDFISFAQYETMNREITQDPPSIFEEQQPRDDGEDKPQIFVSVVVKRDPSLKNNMLASEHGRLVGQTILDRLEEIFEGTDSAIPKIEVNSHPDAAKLLASLKQLASLFLISGYAFGSNVSLVSEDPKRLGASGSKYLISLNAPATLWGGKILQKEGYKLSNDFLLKTATELIKRSGYDVSSTIKYDGTTEEISITIL